MPHEPSITLFSDTLTEWADPGEHFLWGTYDVFPRPAWWQRLLGTPATHEFRLRMADLSSALDVSDRGRFLGANMRLREAAQKWAVPLDWPSHGSWFSNDADVHVACYYVDERRFATLSMTFSSRPELRLKAIGFLRLASALIASGGPFSAGLPDFTEDDEHCSSDFSRAVCEQFCELVDELVTLAGQARSEDASRNFAGRGRR